MECRTTHSNDEELRWKEKFVVEEQSVWSILTKTKRRVWRMDQSKFCHQCIFVWRCTDTIKLWPRSVHAALVACIWTLFRPGCSWPWRFLLSACAACDGLGDIGKLWTEFRRFVQAKDVDGRIQQTSLDRRIVEGCRCRQ